MYSFLIYIMYNNTEFGRRKYSRSYLINKFCPLDMSPCSDCKFYITAAPHCYIINIDNVLFKYKST